MFIKMKLEKGQSMVEYGLILLLVSVVSVLVLAALGNNSVLKMYEKVSGIVEILGS